METFSILLIIVTMAIGSLGLSHVQDQDPSFCELSRKLENQCASYCYKVVKPMLHMTEMCRKKDEQILELQYQLQEAKIQIAVLETSLKEKDNLCKIKIQHAHDIFVIEMKSKMEQLKFNSQQKYQQIQTLRSNGQGHMPDLKETILPSSCVEIDRSSGVHMIKVHGMEAFPVKCESHVAGLGWTVILSRQDGSVNFYRSWMEYREGFGDLSSEFFIGLEKLHRVTSSEPHELFIFMRDKNLQLRSARYNDLKIGGEETDYQLISLGNYTGYSDDILRNNLYMKFSTYDRDNDKCDNSNCAVDLYGGWWYNCCSESNLNGGYFETDPSKRIFWRYNSDELVTVKMLIRAKRANLCNKSDQE